MMDLLSTFEDRLSEIVDYIYLLEMLDRHVQDRQGKIGNGQITERHQKMLYSSVYLQIYNLVESTISSCIKAVTHTTVGNVRPGELSSKMLREWVKQYALTHKEMSPETRLDYAVKIIEFVISADALKDWTPTGGGGNWDDLSIEEMATRLGFELSINASVMRSVKRQVRNDKGLLRLVRDLRNQLAHGSVSFVECAGDVTPQQLREYIETAGEYLREIVKAFDSGIQRRLYLANPASAMEPE